MHQNRAAKYLVKEREYIGLSKRLAWSGGRRVAMYGPWKTIGAEPLLVHAEELRRQRNAGLFERCVFYKGKLVVDATGRLLQCVSGRHGSLCICDGGWD